MSQLQQHLPAEVIAAATSRELVEVAQTLLTAAYDKTRDAHNNGHDSKPGRARGEVAGLSDDELLDQVLLTQQVQNSAWATQTVRLQQLADREYVKHPDHPDNWTPLEIGARLGWTDRQTTLRLTQAIEAVRCTPRLLDHAGTGSLEARKVTAVSGVVADAPDTSDQPEASESAADLAAVIEGEIVASDPAGSTSTKLHRRAQRLLAKHAPVQTDQAAAKRRRGYTDVTVEPHWEPGLSTIHATMPALDAAKLMAAINSHARLLHQSTTTGKSLGECRVDALIDLILSDVQVNTELVLHVPFHPDTAAAPAPGSDEATAGTQGSNRGSRGNTEVHTGPGCPITKTDYQAALDDLDTRHAQLIHATDKMPESARPPAMPDPTNLDDWLDYIHHCPQTLLDEELEALLATPEVFFGPPDRPPDPDPDSAPDPGSAATPTRYAIGDTLIPGVGIVPAAAIRELTRLLGTKLSRALVDADTGTVAETSCHSYKPGARLAGHVRARDRHCRFPGCTRPAKLTDLDHVTRYPDGPTAAHNLQCLCRHHHRAKHEGGWTVTMTPDGTCTWTSPAGHTYLTRPDD